MPQPNSLLLMSICVGVSNTFSKSRMNVSTCPPLSKSLAQSFITIVNWVSQLCLFLNACCLSERSLYASRWAMMCEHTMCSSNLQGTSWWDGMIITCESPVTPKLGVVEISTQKHFRPPLLIQISINVSSSPRLSGIGMSSPIFWSHLLKMQRIVLLNSLLWWELGTNFPNHRSWWMIIVSPFQQ